jgi:hypothetical protein
MNAPAAGFDNDIFRVAAEAGSQARVLEKAFAIQGCGEKTVVAGRHVIELKPSAVALHEALLAACGVRISRYQSHPATRAASRRIRSYVAQDGASVESHDHLQARQRTCFRHGDNRFRASLP